MLFNLIVLANESYFIQKAKKKKSSILRKNTKRRENIQKVEGLKKALI